MACATPLAWYDNVPLLSFALLRGRCRHCKAAIPWRYPLVEATTALLVAACVLRFGLTWDAAVGAFFCAALVAISATDAETHIIRTGSSYRLQPSCSRPTRSSTRRWSGRWQASA